MAVDSLKCKECGSELRARAPRFVCEHCFGPLEVQYDLSGLDPDEAKRKIQAGSRGIWRYADFLPFDGRPRDPLEPGLTPLVKADRLAERLGLGEVWIKNDAANPTHSFKDRVVAVAVAKAKELGFETVACASTGNLANAVAAHAAAAGLDSYVFVPADLEEQKLLATGVYGTKLVGVSGNYDDVNRLCTELSQDAAVGVRQRQPAPLLRRGLEDPRLRDDRAARLGAARPDRRPDRVGLDVHQGRPGHLGLARAGPGRGRAAHLQRRPGARAAPRSRRRSPTARTSASRRSPTRSPRASRSATPPTAPTRSIWRARTGGSIDSVTDDEIRAGISLLAETTGIFTETAGGVTMGVLAKLAERGDIDPGERVVVYITGEGLKTLDAVRESVPHARDRPHARGLRARVRGRGRRLGFPPMAVTVKIPAQLRAATGGEGELEVEGGTVGEALDAVFNQHDGLRERITQDGDLRRFVNVYVSGEDIRFQDGLETAVNDGDEVTILPAVAGG